MKRHFFILIFFMSILSNIFGQSYESLWKSVNDAKRKDFPKQVIEHAEQIYAKASKEKCYPQLMKSWITIIETKSNLDPENFDIDKFPPLPRTNPAEEAIYNAVMGAAYYVMRDTYITQDDEETQIDYQLKADQCFAAALTDRKNLAATSATDYAPLTTSGADSKYFNHDLLSLITHFIIEHGHRTFSQNADLCAAAADYYQEVGNREAWTLMTLKKLENLKQHEDYKVRIGVLKDYLQTLKEMVDQTKDLNAGADVASAYLQELVGEDLRLDFARWANKQFAQTKRTRLFESTESQIMAPSLSISLDGNALANQPFNISLHAKNEVSGTLEVRKFIGYDKNHNVKADGPLLLTRQYAFCQDSVMTDRRQRHYPTTDNQKDTLSLPAGHYVYVLQGKSGTSIEEAQITSLRLLCFSLPDRRILAQVVSNETGRPVSQASVRLTDVGEHNTLTLQCDQKGEILFNVSGANYRYATAFIEGTEDSTARINISSYHPSGDEDQEKHQWRHFTDRAIYRPGQTVHVSGIAYKQLKDETQVMKEADNTLTLRDANHREIAHKTVITNAMGTYDVDFELPKDVMPGHFSIRDEQWGSVSFRVEEYKRPTFQVDAHLAMGQNQEDNASFSFGDTIPVEAVAKTFSGVPVQGASVHYKLETAEVDFWRWYETSWDVLEQGDLITDDQGKVSLPVFLDPKKLQSRDYGLVRYRATFEVTDQAGETRSDSYQVAVSHRSFSLSISVSSEIDRANQTPDEHFIIEAINASRKPVSVQGTYSIINTSSPYTTIVEDRPFASGQELQLPAGLTPGSYRIVAKASDRDQTEIRAEQDFQLYNSKLAIDLKKVSSTKDNPANHTLFSNNFFHQVHREITEQQPAEVLFSPLHDDVYVGYMVLTNDKLIERGNVVLGRQQYLLSIPYDKAYGDGLTLRIWYVRQGQVVEESMSYQYQTPDKHLQLSWSTFRDRLYPGQDEEWTLTIHDPAGKPVVGAELLATMYDASLDQLAQHSWPFYVGFNRFVHNWSFYNSYPNYGHSLSTGRNISLTFDSSRSFDQLQEFIHDRYSRQMVYMDYMGGGAPSRGRGAMPMMAMAESSAMRSNSMLADQMVEEEAEPVYKLKSVADTAEEETSASQHEDVLQVDMRSNFAETAFFYPHLLSDAKGDVKISFTLPESLTEWKFMGLAHTADVRYGSITAQAVARKDFMIQPNMPRFVREGDQAVITARVINQCDHDLSGDAQIRLIDPESDQLVHTATVPFSVEAQQTTAVSFALDIDDRYPMLICEVVALSGTSSDGERNYLPVLTSRKYITEAIPFYIMRDEREKHLDLTEIFNQGSPTATHRRMLLEFTERPEWTVIEALEGIKLPEHDNAPSFAAALYSNTMAQRLAASIPGFEQALIQAREQGIEANSQLDENQDLKDIVSTESPWVRDAQAEAQQRQRLIELFDEQLMSQRLASAKAKLQKLQLSDGSWTWFEGMPGNYYITLSTCHSLALLQSADPDVQHMLQAGMQFLDKVELKNYQECLKQKYTLFPSNSTIDYLYLWSLMPDRTVSKDLRKMRDAYLKLIERNVADLTIQGRSTAAVILRAFGHNRSADDFLESAIQYSVTKPGMGRYYATDAAYYSWRDYRIPTQLAVMQALRMSPRADRYELMREMQVWLLRQKQAQCWDSPMNTIAAVDFLLHEGEGMTPSDSQAGQVAFLLDQTQIPTEIDSTRFLANQLGYIRTQVDEQHTKQPHHELVVVKAVTDPASLTQSPVISWGALYTQYLEEMDRLRQQTTGELKVSVKLIVPDAPQGTDQAELHVGDKVTMRLILTADRDMDFVQVRMQRPACFEPDQQVSGYRWMNGRGGYVAQHDASTDLFFDTFRRGTMTYDIDYHVDRAGTYLSGVTTAQCAYSPEFVAHTSALRVIVK